MDSLEKAIGQVRQPLLLTRDQCLPVPQCAEPKQFNRKAGLF